MSAPRVHATVTFPVSKAGAWTWSWACGNCPAKAIRNYPSKTAAERVAAIHEDPSHQGRTSAATKN